MRTALECLGCMIVQAVRAARLASSDPRIQERILREALTDAGLYIADHAGEIVFERLVIELLNPAKVTLAVRGRPILNDATLEDAGAGGLTDIVLVIDTGSDLAGVVMDECSEEFQRHFTSADLVLAKGQGNYETLDDVVAPIWLAFKVKCAVVARATGRNVGESVLCRQRTQRAEGREIGASVS